MPEFTDKDGKCSQGCQRIEVPSDQEVEALNAMRQIKTRVRELQKALSPLSVNHPAHKEERQRLEKQIERLKKEWGNWEDKRREAARLRMILLGHEKAE